MMEKSNLFQGDRSRWGMYIVFALVAGVVSIIQSPIMFPDSGTYLSASPIRTLAYPMTLKLFNLVLGSYGLKTLLAFQLFFVMSVSRVLVNCIADVFDLNGYVKLMLFFISLYPWLLVGELRFAMVVLTEPLTYVFAVSVIIGITKLSENYSFNSLILCGIWFLLAMLLRSQMTFMWGGFMALAMYYAWYHKAYKNAFLVVLVASSMVVLSLGINSVYQVKMFGKTDSSFAYSQALVPALYILNQDTISQVESEDSRNMLTSIYAAMKTRCLLKSSLDDAGCGALGKEHYMQSYTRIYYKVMSPIVMAYTKSQGLSSMATAYQDLAYSLFVIKLTKEPFSLLKQYVHSMVVFGLHGRHLTLAFGVLLMMSMARLRYQNDSTSTMLALFLIFHLCNLVLVSFFEANLFRYMFYTEVPLMVMMFAFLSQYLMKVSQR
ncbi:MAG TPA: hypothetical protein QF353_03150 [Gammaproteobacteria bacterium]|nr:hypothetical protein [Gammaproteobacteria bacterium]